MVKKNLLGTPLTFLFVLLFSVASIASDSGVYSFRAHRSFSSGKFAKGYKQLEKALLASRKESDLLSEGRILIDMAQIRTMSLDFALADTLLSAVRPQSLDATTLTQFARAKAALAIAQKDYRAATRHCESVQPDSLKEADKPSQAAYYADCAIAYTGIGQTAIAFEHLKQVVKRTDKKGGYYTFTAARVAELSKQNTADSLYRAAEAKAIQGNIPYMTATILYHRSELDATPAAEKADLKLRCKNAFELMGLPNNSKRCAE
ncbi:MAG: hypothetical protein HUK20_07865 [Fibrobacter sp.]|nr:hypothetical protein [Fibrobacter sp.]